MRDIDYDELDRAMNQLIVEKQSADDNVSSSNAQPAATAQVAPKQQPDLKPVSSSSGNQVDRPIPSLANRRSGKFMDLVSKQSAVHPVSQTPVVTPNKPVEQKQAINPSEINKPNGPLISSFVPRTGSVGSSPRSTSAEGSLEPPKPEFELPKTNEVVPSANEVVPKSDFNTIHSDVLSNNKTSDTTVTKDNSVEDDDSDINRIADDINKTLGLKDDDAKETNDENTVESPFISDAKVEKRPLGAFSTSSSNEIASPDVSTVNNTADAAAVSPKFDNQNGVDVNPSLNTPLPAELDGDLLSIESNGVAKPVEKNEIAETKADEKSSEKEINPELTADNKNPVEKTVESDKTISTPTPSSIAPVIAEANKQDKKTSSKDQSTPIYDNTNTVNKALLQKSPKKKGGVIKVILWMLLLVVLGVGAGALVYFIVLPNL